MVEGEDRAPSRPNRATALIVVTGTGSPGIAMPSHRMSERVLTERTGHWMAMPQAGVVAATSPEGSVAEVPQEVVDFIRYCYQRRRIGWPELYDEMCGVAARGEFRGMDYDRLAALGVRFSLCEMNHLAAMAQRVVTEERRRRVAIPVEPRAIALDVAPAEDPLSLVDAAAR
jgi:hypothetical protein